MNLLFLGGTNFVGRHMVEAAQAAGHTITLFNRGQTNPDLFSDVEQLRGDRDGLVLRPPVETVRDTIAWDAGRPADEPRRAGMSAAAEKILLDHWPE